MNRAGEGGILGCDGENERDQQLQVDESRDVTYVGLTPLFFSYTTYLTLGLFPSSPYLVEEHGPLREQHDWGW